MKKQKQKLKLISKASDHIGKSRFRQAYKNPLPEKIKSMEHFFDLLHKEGNTVMSKEFEQACIDFNIRKTKITNEIFLFEGPHLETPVTFFWRVGAMKIPGKLKTYSNPIDPLILEAPHEGKDNTGRTATKIFEKTNAKIIVMNAVHPKVGKKGIRCKAKSYNSDGAHCEETLFHKVHVKLYEMFPYAFFVQLHGWANSKFLMMCMNGHNNLFTRNKKSGPLLFARAGITTYNKRSRKRIFMGDKGLRVHGYKRPGGFHNTCVQARHLNGGNQCKVGDVDMGNFLHIELGQRLIKKSRYYRHNIKKICKTLNLAMEDWVKLNDDLELIEIETETEMIKDKKPNTQSNNEIEIETETEIETESLNEEDFYADTECTDCETITDTECTEIIIEDPDEYVVEVDSNYNCCLPIK